VQLYEGYGMRIRRLRLPARWSGSLLDISRGRSLLPLSLDCLVLGECLDELRERDAAMTDRAMATA